MINKIVVLPLMFLSILSIKLVAIPEKSDIVNNRQLKKAKLEYIELYSITEDDRIITLATSVGIFHLDKNSDDATHERSRLKHNGYYDDNGASIILFIENKAYQILR